MSAVTLIDFVEVGSGGQAIIDFTSLPTDGTYTDLKIVLCARAETTVDYIDLRFNASTSGFTSRYILGSNTTIGYYSRSDQLHSTTITPSSYGANGFSACEIYIPNYAGSLQKNFFIDTGIAQNSTLNGMEVIAGFWSPTTAISQVTLRTGSGDFAEFSTCAIYGILAGNDGVTSVS